MVYLEQNNVRSDDIIRIESDPDTNGNLHAVKKVLTNYKKYDICIRKSRQKRVGALSNEYHRERIERFAKDILKDIELKFISAEDVFSTEHPNKLFPQEFKRRKFKENNGIQDWDNKQYRDQFRAEAEWKARCHDPNL